MWTHKPPPKQTLADLTTKAGTWSIRVGRRLDRELPSKAASFAGNPPAADPDPTQGDFGRLEDYIDARVDALKALLGEDESE
jgi:hypothetical protein